MALVQSEHRSRNRGSEWAFENFLKFATIGFGLKTGEGVLAICEYTHFQQLRCEGMFHYTEEKKELESKVAVIHRGTGCPGTPWERGCVWGLVAVVFWCFSKHSIFVSSAALLWKGKQQANTIITLFHSQWSPMCNFKLFAYAHSYGQSLDFCPLHGHKTCFHTILYLNNYLYFINKLRLIL